MYGPLLKDIREWCRLCQDCQASKFNRHTKPGFSFQVPVSGRFQVVHIDIIGKLPRPGTQMVSTVNKDIY